MGWEGERWIREISEGENLGSWEWESETIKTREWWKLYLRAYLGVFNAGGICVFNFICEHERLPHQARKLFAANTAALLQLPTSFSRCIDMNSYAPNTDPGPGPWMMDQQRYAHLSFDQTLCFLIQHTDHVNVSDSSDYWSPVLYDSWILISYTYTHWHVRDYCYIRIDMETS